MKIFMRITTGAGYIVNCFNAGFAARDGDAVMFVVWVVCATLCYVSFLIWMTKK